MSEPDRWQQLVDEAAKDEVVREAAASRPPERHRSIPLWGTLGLSLVALAFAWFYSQDNEKGPGAPDLEIGRRAALMIAVGKVRDFASRNGRYPETLKEAMPLELGIGYRRLDDGFELTASLPDGKTLTVRER